MIKKPHIFMHFNHEFIYFYRFNTRRNSYIFYIFYIMKINKEQHQQQHLVLSKKMKQIWISIEKFQMVKILFFHTNCVSLSVSVAVAVTVSILELHILSTVFVHGVIALIALEHAICSSHSCPRSHVDHFNELSLSRRRKAFLTHQPNDRQHNDDQLKYD